MTTTAYDCEKKLVACDTRWSMEINLIDGRHILFVDDTGFNKICTRKGGALICAGDGLTIAEIKDWWRAQPFDPEALPKLRSEEGQDLVSIMIIDANGKREFDVGHKVALLDTELDVYVSIFSGSGSTYAARTFSQCGCVKSAVELSKYMDPCTGGEVKYLELQSGNHNLSDENFDYDSITEAMSERGGLMKKSELFAANSRMDAKVISIKDHAQYSDIANALKSGALKAHAPTGGQHIEWDEGRIERLKQAARRIAELEASMDN
ncbi:hypothetical protein SOASR032_24120 [Pragia fontium]|uniref:Uncharacterized protein n=1 Tax=Pragia fontium TaxID=82985 RepID=A0ABQ5LJN6_9GAMM|nr:hypothetical protein [Pragia fontium]GKX63843.1 hypothetical protein SOASR032_24120 [Pragia fontium]